MGAGLGAGAGAALTGHAGRDAHLRGLAGDPERPKIHQEEVVVGPAGDDAKPLVAQGGRERLGYSAAAGIATGASCCSTTERSGSSQNAHMAEPMTSRVAATMNGACQLAYWAK